MTSPRKLVILGATGSVGCSTLDLVRHAPDRFHIVGLSGHRNIDLLFDLASEFRPDFVAITDISGADRATRDKFANIGVTLLSGPDAAQDLVALPHDMTIAAIVGAAGLKATWHAASLGRMIAVANKECIVCGGSLFMVVARANGASLLPIDSEHNAIFQAMRHDPADHIRRLVLTASGGPFRDWDLADMQSITVAQALAHPTWQMGQKISIDSATMMNKGLEVIEAHHLFSMPADKIDVVVHPQSVIHSLVEYCDGSMLAQMGTPDMRIPIAHALAWPQRMPTPARRLDLLALSGLSFEAPDDQRFPCLNLARQALLAGDAACIILNAANEMAVAAFLQGRLRFIDISVVIAAVLDHISSEPVSSLDDVLALDEQARSCARDVISRCAASAT